MKRCPELVEGTDPNASIPNGKLNKTWLTWATAHTDALTITALLTVLIFETLYLRGWTYLIFGDRSFHLYSAQEIARGRIPYADFFNLHPPLALMLLALPMWIFPKLMTGVGPVYVHITWTVLWTAAGVVATYYIGKRLSGSWLGGALAGWLLVGLTPLLIIHAVVGENRILIVTAIVLGWLCRRYWPNDLLPDCDGDSRCLGACHREARSCAMA
jgi:hypothetical protein